LLWFYFFFFCFGAGLLDFRWRWLIEVFRPIVGIFSLEFFIHWSFSLDRWNFLGLLSSFDGAFELPSLNQRRFFLPCGLVGSSLEFVGWGLLEFSVLRFWSALCTQFSTALVCIFNNHHQNCCLCRLHQ